MLPSTIRELFGVPVSLKANIACLVLSFGDLLIGPFRTLYHKLSGKATKEPENVILKVCKAGFAVIRD